MTDVFDFTNVDTSNLEDDPEADLLPIDAQPLDEVPSASRDLGEVDWGSVSTEGLEDLPDTINFSVRSALDNDPKATQKAVDLSEATGLPVSLTRTDDGSLAREAQAARIAEMLGEAPSSKRWVEADPLNADLAGPEMEKLPWFENLWRGFLTGGASTLAGLSEAADFVSREVLTPPQWVTDVMGAENYEPQGLVTLMNDASSEIMGLMGIEKDYQATLDAIRVDPDAATGYRPEEAVSLDEVKENPLLAPQFALEQSVRSAPEMIASMISLPLTLLMVESRLAQDRALADGREDPTVWDYLQVLPWSIASGILDRIGGKALVGAGAAARDVGKKGIKWVGKETGITALKEMGTEAVQETLEITASTLGTEQGLASIDQYGDAALGGAIGGFFMGGGIRAGSATYQARKEATVTQRRAEILREMNGEELEMRQTSPAAFAEYQGSLMRDAGIEEVVLSEEGRVLLQEQLDLEGTGIDPALQSPLRDALMDVVAASGVQITPEQFWALPKETIDALSTHVSLIKGETSAAEAKEISDLVAAASKVDPEAQGQTAVNLAEAENLFAEIQSRINAVEGALSGDPAAGRAAAEQMTAAFVTMSQRSGVPLDRVKELFLPRIVRGEIQRRDDQARTFEQQQAAEFGTSVEAFRAEVEAANGVVTETPSFKKWFKESVVVDENGVPLRVYHGTDADIKAFDPSLSRAAIKGLGVFLSSSPPVAATYATGSSGRNVIPAYASLQTPVVVEAAGKVWSQLGPDTVIRIPARAAALDPDAALLSELGVDVDAPARRDYAAQEVRVSDLGLVGRDGTVTTNDIAKWAKEQDGIDGVVFKDIVDRGPGTLDAASSSAALQPATNFLVFDPSQIKSVFNQGGFDPASDNILYQDGETLSDLAQAALDSGAFELSPEENAASSVSILYNDDFPAQPRSTVKEVAAALMERSKLNYGEYTPENVKRVGDIMAVEALHAILQDGNAATWYRDKVEEAHRIAALAFPEIATDPIAATSFNYILAVTSNGSTVAENSTNAFALYKEFRSSLPSVPTNSETATPYLMPIKGFGKETPSMEMAFRIWNNKVEQYGIDAWVEFLGTEYRVGDLNDAGWSVSGELVETRMPGSVVIGSKIGGGFFANLQGNFKSLTMDLWYMRTWGRLTGTLVVDQDQKTATAQRERFHDALSTWTPGKLKSIGLDVSEYTGKKRGFKGLEDDQLLEVAHLLRRLDAQLGHVRPKGSDAKKSKAKETLAKKGISPDALEELIPLMQAAKPLSESQGAILEQPGGGSHRAFMREATQSALDKLSAEAGVELDLADLQAVIWYPEKDLWKKMGVGNKRSAPTDYATEFAVLAKKEGIDDARIQGAVQAGDDGGGPARDGSSSGSRSGEGDAATPLNARNAGVLNQGDNILEQRERGSIDFSNMQDIVIRLTEAENLSTLLHESGHLYLEMMSILSTEETASPQMKADMQTVLDWMGLDSAQDITTEHHEKWAETYEAYLRTGKAPSAELRSAFNKFTAWLTTIYKSLTKIGRGRADLSPEIRAVMDRMLATDEQIAQVQEEQAMMPLFPDAESAGRTEEEHAAYLTEYEEMRQAAHAELLQEALAETKREKLKWWREGLAAEKERILKTLDDDDAWSARHIIQHGNMPSGATIPEGRPTRLKLDRKRTAEAGYDLPGGNQLFGRDGVSADRAAQELGFQSGDQLLQALANLPKDENGKFLTAQQLAAQQADTAMREIHGDLTNDAALHEEALAKLHSRTQADVLLGELKTLHKMNGSTARATQRVMRLAAEEAIAEKAYSEIGSPTKYLNAERRYGMKAAEALVAGNLEEAIQHKNRQLLNFHMYRQARDVKAKADKQIDRMKKWQTKPPSPKTHHPVFLKELRLLLQDINFRSQMTEKRISQMSIETLTAWAEQQNKEYGASFHISAELDDALSKQNIREMTPSEIEGLHDTAKSLVTQARKYNQAEDAQFKQLEQEGAVSVEQNVVGNVVIPTDAGWWDGVKATKRLWFAEHRQIRSLTQELDGGKESGWFYRNIYQPIKRADDRYLDRGMRAAETLNGFMNVYTTREKAGFYSKTYIPELGESLSRNALLSFALNMGNAGNVSVMEDLYTDAQIEAVLAKLTDKDWDVVENIWAHIDSYWKDLSALEERTTGVAPAKVEAVPFTLPSGRKISGGYYPLSMDPKKSDIGRANFEASQELTTFTNGGRAKISTKHGSTIERSGFGTNPIWMDLRVAFDHVDGVIRDIEMREAVADVARFTRAGGPLANAIQASKGAEYNRVLRAWLENTVEANKPPMTSVEKLSTYARAGVSVAEMGLSVRTVLMQPFGYTNSVAYLGEKYATIGMAKFVGNPSQAVKDAMALSPFMRNRARTFNREAREVGRWMGKRGLQTKVTAASFWGISRLDLAVSIPTWHGAYQKAVDNGSSIEDAVDLADEAVSRSQGSGLPRDMADIQQGAAWKKLFTMFYNFFGAYYNMQSDQWKQTSFKSPASALKWAKNQLWLTVIPSIAVDALFNGLPDDDDELPQWAALSLVKYMFGGVVIARDVANSVFTGFDYQISPTANLAKSVSNSITQIRQGEADAALAKALVMLVGYGARLPGARQVNRAISVVTDDDWEADEFESWWRLFVMGPDKD